MLLTNTRVIRSIRHKLNVRFFLQNKKKICQKEHEYAYLTCLF